MQVQAAFGGRFTIKEANNYKPWQGREADYPNGPCDMAIQIIQGVLDLERVGIQPKYRPTLESKKVIIDVPDQFDTDIRTTLNQKSIVYRYQPFQSLFTAKAKRLWQFLSASRQEV